MTNKYAGQHILVMGYALTGKSIVNYLQKESAKITLNDRGDLSQDPSVNLLLKSGVRVVDKGHPLEILEGIDFIVKTPGIPYSLEIIQEALHRGIPIYTDVELAYRESLAPIIGITGSNGKTTTTCLAHHLLEGSWKGKVELAGNVGVPSIEVAQEVNEADLIVMELSSFQLMGTQSFHPQIAVFTNIYSAHLDYHGTRQDYIAAKLKLIQQMTEKDYLIYNADQTELEEWLKDSPAIKVPFSRQKQVNSGAYIKDHSFYFQGQEVALIDQFNLPGKHNLENALAAIAIAKIQGVKNAAIQEKLASFAGIRHRIQPLGTIKGIKFYNDSKATNTVATITALKSFDQDIIYIGGGLDRGNDFQDLIPYLNKVKAAFLYGESKEKMERDFRKAKVKTIKLFENLDQASQAAISFAQEGQIVLFSPACASWDQFKNYEIRGDRFIEQVESFRREA
ncbi:UDP-N-acetylmuramoyl-L-alanine--D-glutamate ligase [Facklamia sp. 7083-14-GEN3]|uniref:UDP-N-acetylmuramoyl-L-alanine--D-glutamate ligase n=1 Tax=Facklamia sp. 7083-14-GEN3 TaxID=2973478 RepID=UPI00215BFDDA|nr:UDP-N-acetylmuramoyl-L-alanine--D-glutamate ligase [Facklamia sp. 7083-14-GEN3]MCR8969159.1 UDP-N-acetylmuramoyl-L-alanine--D-glutamate ligase [Facklamia sp. 7083-14-GEN3]